MKFINILLELVKKIRCLFPSNSFMFFDLFFSIKNLTKDVEILQFFYYDLYQAVFNIFQIEYDCYKLILKIIHTYILFLNKYFSFEKV